MPDNTAGLCYFALLTIAELLVAAAIVRLLVRQPAHKKQAHKADGSDVGVAGAVKHGSPGRWTYVASYVLLAVVCLGTAADNARLAVGAVTPVTGPGACSLGRALDALHLVLVPLLVLLSWTVAADSMPAPAAGTASASASASASVSASSSSAACCTRIGTVRCATAGIAILLAVLGSGTGLVQWLVDLAVPCSVSTAYSLSTTNAGAGASIPFSTAGPAVAGLSTIAATGFVWYRNAPCSHRGRISQTVLCAVCAAGQAGAAAGGWYLLYGSNAWELVLEVTLLWVLNAAVARTHQHSILTSLLLAA